MGDLAWDPEGYLAMVTAEVPSYAALQAHTVAATGAGARRVLELGFGTGETARRVLERHPDAEYVGLDASAEMLAYARARLPRADLRRARLEDALPEGPFELVVSALAVHHLDGPGKADLFRRVAAVLAPGGRFVLGDLVVPEDPADVVTDVDGVHDTPSRTDEQLRWLAAAGLAPRVVWRDRDLAVLVADAPPG